MKLTRKIFYFMLPVLMLYSCNAKEAETEYRCEVFGSSVGYDVKIQIADNDTQQFKNAKVDKLCIKWKQSHKSSLYVSAQNRSPKEIIIVKIYRAGRIVAENKSDGLSTVAFVKGLY
jgi:hypothetical protein